jgi:hypothetical protein
VGGEPAYGGEPISDPLRPSVADVRAGAEGATTDPELPPAGEHRVSPGSPARPPGHDLELSPGKAALWVFSVVALLTGIVLTQVSAAAQGFGLGLGTGMVAASAICLLVLAIDLFRPHHPSQDPIGSRGPLAGDGSTSSSGPADGEFAPSNPESDEPSQDSVSDDTLELRNGERRAFQLFQLPEDASLQEITAAYHRLAHLHHPDKMAGEPEQIRRAADAHMKEINAAFELLVELRNSPL